MLGYSSSWQLKSFNIKFKKKKKKGREEKIGDMRQKQKWLEDIANDSSSNKSKIRL